MDTYDVEEENEIELVYVRICDSEMLLMKMIMITRRKSMDLIFGTTMLFHKPIIGFRCRKSRRRIIYVYIDLYTWFVQLLKKKTLNFKMEQT